MLFAGVFGGAAEGATGDVPGREAGFLRTSGFGCVTAGGTAVFVDAGAWPAVPAFGGVEVGDFGGVADGATGDVPGSEAGFFRTSGLGCATAGGTAVFVGAGACPAVPAFGGAEVGDVVRFTGAGAVAGAWPAGA